MKKYDAVVIGSGPNGLAAAITLAKAGHSVIVYERAANPGGGARSEELTLPGFVHDVCSAVHPLAIASPFFESLNLRQYGLEWIDSPAPLAHPLESGEAVILHQSVEATAARLGKDEPAYLDLMKPLQAHWQDLFSEILQPVLHWPHHPILLARFGLNALSSAEGFAKRVFHTPQAQALFAGIAAHANAPLSQAGTSAIGLMLNLAAHARGWPIPRGGSQAIADALIACLRAHGGEIEVRHEIESVGQLPESHWVFFDQTPRQILKLLEKEISPRAARSLSQYKYGPGVFKMDWALSEPIPWKAKECLQAATVHLGGTLEEIAASEVDPMAGRVSERPYILLSQPTVFDPSRAPEGKHTVWAYCHVPHASNVDLTEVMEKQIERFAPGFRDTILARHVSTAVDLERKNPNLVGGDISGGQAVLRQLLFRPAIRLNPYRLPGEGNFICSSSTPPGPGVHGMCGFMAAQSALNEKFLAPDFVPEEVQKNPQFGLSF